MQQEIDLLLSTSKLLKENGFELNAQCLRLLN